MSTPKMKRPKVMKPADLVITRFGGVRPLARKLSLLYRRRGDDPIAVSTVQRWRSRESGIPDHRFKDLQSLAKQEKITLTAEELINGGVA